MTQELALLSNLTIAENMFLGKEPTLFPGRVDQRRMARETAKRLEAFGVSLDPATFVGSLTIADKQIIEIAHAASTEAAVYVLDEPTAALNAPDVDVLKRHVQALTRRGARASSISRTAWRRSSAVCDTVSILKDGRNVETVPIAVGVAQAVEKSR